MKHSDTIIKPVISERSFSDAQKGVYSFVVNPKARKNEIAAAINELFGVKVVSISTNNTPKIKNITTKTSRRQKSIVTKKARVRLADGQKIDLFEEEGNT